MEVRGRSQWSRGGLKWSRVGSALCKPVVTVSHYFDEEQDQDPGISISVKSWIRISIKVIRICNPDSKCYKK